MSKGGGQRFELEYTSSIRCNHFEYQECSQDSGVGGMSLESSTYKFAIVGQPLNIVLVEQYDTDECSTAIVHVC
jgi:hypothetical protein